MIPLGKKITVRAGTPLIDVLHEYGVEFPCGGKGSCGSCKVRVLKGEIGVEPSHRSRLKELGLSHEWRLACQSHCQMDVSLEVDQYEVLIQADETPFPITPGKGLGIAFDLGTTTLVGQLLDLSTGKVLAVETALNPQSKFGTDLISRLESALAGERKQLVTLIRQKIGEMVRALLGTNAAPVQKMVMVGNTVMQHLFSDFDIAPLSYFPFESPHLAMQSLTTEELEWSLPVRQIDFYPSIGSFVGSDILAGIMATGMHLKKEYSILIDLGTNGEIVAGNCERLVCASTAAGPAFEGARISMGMLATTGAISSLSFAGGEWNGKVIGGSGPRGICGSGLIDAVALLLEERFLGEFGEILSGEGEVRLLDPVVITQKDIQEFQLAKSAIATGLEILINHLGVSPEKIASVYIAGAFGSYINLDHVRRTGMLDFPVDIIHQLGNTALMGAKMFLFADHSVPDAILSGTSHVNLESDPGFQDLFVKNLSFRVAQH